MFSSEEIDKESKKNILLEYLKACFAEKKGGLKKEKAEGDSDLVVAGNPVSRKLSDRVALFDFLKAYGRPFGQGSDGMAAVAASSDESNEVMASLLAFYDDEKAQLTQLVLKEKERLNITIPPVGDSEEMREFMNLLGNKLREFERPLEKMLKDFFKPLVLNQKTQSDIDELINKLRQAYTYNLGVAVAEREMGSTPNPLLFNCYSFIARAALSEGDVFDNYSLLMQEEANKLFRGERLPSRTKLELVRSSDNGDHVLSRLGTFPLSFEDKVISLLSGMDINQKEFPPQERMLEQATYLRNRAILSKLCELALPSEEHRDFLFGVADQYGFGEGMRLVFELTRLEKIKSEIGQNPDLDAEIKLHQMTLEKFILELELKALPLEVKALEESEKRLKIKMVRASPQKKEDKAESTFSQPEKKKKKFTRRLLGGSKKEKKAVGEKGLSPPSEEDKKKARQYRQEIKEDLLKTTKNLESKKKALSQKRREYELFLSELSAQRISLPGVKEEKEKEKTKEKGAKGVQLKQPVPTLDLSRIHADNKTNPEIRRSRRGEGMESKSSSSRDVASPLKTPPSKSPVSAKKREGSFKDLRRALSEKFDSTSHFFTPKSADAKKTPRKDEAKRQEKEKKSAREKEVPENQESTPRSPRGSGSSG
jgi:hypothetical protein